MRVLVTMFDQEDYDELIEQLQQYKIDFESLGNKGGKYRFLLNFSNSTFYSIFNKLCMKHIDSCIFIDKNET